MSPRFEQPISHQRRALAVIVSFVLLAQTFAAAAVASLAVTGTTLPDGASIICHSGDAPTPDGGKTQHHVPCGLCCLAAPGHLILPVAVELAVAMRPWRPVVRQHLARAFSASHSPRAGPARAPPHLA